MSEIIVLASTISVPFSKSLAMGWEMSAKFLREVYQSYYSRWQLTYRKRTRNLWTSLPRIKDTRDVSVSLAEECARVCKIYENVPRPIFRNLELTSESNTISRAMKIEILSISHV